MERQSFFRKVTMLIAFILSLGLMLTGILLPVKNSYADTEPNNPNNTTYTVAFKVGEQLYVAYKLNSGQTVTQPSEGDLYGRTWINTSNGLQFDFNSTINSNITLRLQLASTEAAVVFLKENPNYSSGTNSSDEYVKNKYMGLDVKIITAGQTVSALDESEVPVKNGYKFEHWLSAENATSAFDFSTNIATTMCLYPKYTLKEYTLTFRHYDYSEGNSNTYEVRTVSHGQILTDVPTPKDKPNYRPAGWYDENDGLQTSFIFRNTPITGDMIFLPLYNVADYEINFPSGYANTYAEFGSYADGKFEKFTEQQYAANGGNFDFYIQLNSDYDQHSLIKSNVNADGSKSAFTVSPVADVTGLYKCILAVVGSNITISTKELPKNKYTVEFDLAGAAGISINPTGTVGTDYIIQNGKYKIVYDESFYFELVIDPSFEAKSSLNYNGGQSVFFTEGMVNFSGSRDKYFVLNKNGDSTIAVTVDTVECVTVEFRNINMINYTGFEDVGFDKTLVVWNYDSDNASQVGIARIKKGEPFEFTAAPLNDTYHINNVEGAEFNINTAKYSFRANADKYIVFDVVQTVVVSFPGDITKNGVKIADIRTTSTAISGPTWDHFTEMWVCKIVMGGTLKLEFIFSAPYSNTPVAFDGLLSSITVNRDDFKDNKIIALENITSDLTVKFGEFVKNTYTIGLLEGSMVNLSIHDGASNIVEYDGNLSIKVVKTIPYSDATITRDNITLTAAGVNYELIEVAEEGEQPYYLINISGVKASFTLSVENLSINTYGVSLLGNQYAGLDGASKAQHGSDYIFSYSLGNAYTQTAVLARNVKLIDPATNNEITSYPIEVNIPDRQITIKNVISEIQISIEDLEPNKYVVAANELKHDAFSSDKRTSENVTHGSIYTFTLTFNTAAYTKAADNFNLSYTVNRGDPISLEPTERGMINNYTTLTYTIFNVSGNISFVVPTLNVNAYTVIFYDTNPTIEIYRYNAVVHGNPIQAPTYPVREGGICTGWYLSESGGTSVTNFTSITSDLNLYAVYNTKTFKITFDDDAAGTWDVNVAYGQSYTNLPSITPRPGHTAYWNVEGLNLNSVKENMVINAVYVKNNYTVRFLYMSDPSSGNYDKVFETQSIGYLEKAVKPAENPIVFGYTFVEWDYNINENAIIENTDIRAKFRINEYKVEFINVTQGNGLMASYKLNYNTVMSELEPVAVEGERGKYQFPYYSNGALMAGDSAIQAELSNGFVLEGWYADPDMSVRYNFANPIKGNVTIYGNMYISKVSVKFYVDNEFYIEKLVEYNTTLTDIPAIPRKEGYDHNQPQWVITYPQNGSFEKVTNDIKVNAEYKVNIYTIQFKLPSGDTFVRQVAHGGTVTNVPYPEISFGEVLVMDSNLIQYVTQDTIVYITVIDFLPFMVVAAVAGALTFVVVSLIIAIRNMRRSIKNVKRMEELFAAIKKQDARLTQINEEKLKSELQSKMKEKEKYKRGSFLDD